MERPADHGLAALAARLRALPPSCGPVRLVAVDGHAGSGKSTFAGRLAAALGTGALASGTSEAGAPEAPGGEGPDAGALDAPVGEGPDAASGATVPVRDDATAAAEATAPMDGHPVASPTPMDGPPAAFPSPAPVIHLDDLATHDELFAWDGRLREQVIEPFLEGRSARYGVYDWVHRRFARERTLAPAPVVLLEGVGAGRRALRPHLACLLWMEMPEDAAWARGRRRDGPGLATFWDGWIPAERAHFAADPSRPHADLLVSQGRTGYEWHTRPVDAR